MISRSYPGVLVAAASLLSSAGLAAAEPTPFGLWARDDGKAKVRVERCGSDLCAVNTWIRQGTRGEKAGDKLVMSVKPEDPGHWSGTAFDPQRDMTYRLTLTIEGKSMWTEGCVLAGVVCKEMGWTRIAGE